MSIANLKVIMSKRCIGLLLGLSLFVIPIVILQAAEPSQQRPVPPQGFDRVRDGIEKGKLERVDYDATAVAPV